MTWKRGIRPGEDLHTVQPEMADRIAALIREQDAPVGADTIARDFLKLSGPGGAASRGLVRAILAKDSRFEEVSDGVWGLATRSVSFAPPVVLCALEIPDGSRRAPWLWRVWASLWNDRAEPFQHHGLERTDGLERLLAWLQEHPVLSERPGSLARWIGAQERIHALPEIDPLLIDARTWRRLVDDPRETSLHGQRAATLRKDTGAGADTSDADVGRALLAPLGELLDRIVACEQARSLCSWREVALAGSEERESARDRVWDHDWTFGPEEIAALPEDPGIYRFLSTDGRLLYVGKAKNLRRRVASYFRPLDRGDSPRATFLREIDRFEFDTTGTELEALIREAQLIRSLGPPWNTQVNLEVGEHDISLGEQDLLLLVDRADGGHTLFALGGERVACGVVGEVLDPEALSRALQHFYVEGESTPELSEVPSPERLLVRRWMRGSRDGCTLLRLSDFSTYQAVVEAVGRVVTSAEPPGPGDSATIVREG